MSQTRPRSGAADSTRRTFIKQTTAAAAGAALATGLASRAYAQGSEEIKIGLIGCGGRGTGAAGQALSTSGPVKLVAMADAFEDRVEDTHARLAKGNNIERPDGEDPTKVIEVPADRRFTGFDAYKHVIDSDIDLVVIATPPGFRPIHFEYAVQAGKNVFMEKPVATDAPGIRRVLAANEIAKQKGLKVGVGLQRHHQHIYLETLQRIKEGMIGDITHMRAYWNAAGVWVRPRQPGQTEMEYQMRNWYYFNWLCGDHIVEQHIHNIDVCNWAMRELGDPNDGVPIIAQGQGGREVRKGPEFGEIFDHHFVEFEYENGVQMFSQCRHIKGCQADVSEHIHGTKGYAKISGGLIYDRKGEKLYDAARDLRERGMRRLPNPYQQEHDDLFAAIRSNTPYNEGDYGASSTMTAIWGRMCTYSGRVVRWKDAIESELDIMPKEYAWDATPPILPDETGNYPVAVPGVTKAY